MTIRYADADWRQHAACAGHQHPEWWDGRRDGETVDQRTRRHQAAALVCATCPVKNECWADRSPGEVSAGRWNGQPIKLPEADVVPHERKPFAPAKCGTYSGYRAHYRRGEEPCEPCKVEGRAYTRRWKQRKKEQAS